MERNLGIAVVGGNGSGKSTLGKGLAEALGWKFMDVETYYFPDPASDYGDPRPKEEVCRLLLADMAQSGNFVFSSVGGDMGPEINRRYGLIVYIQVPKEIRLERVKQRSRQKFGSRVAEGGDLYEQEQAFFDMVAGRSLDRIDDWIRTMNCPVLSVDGCKPPEENAQLIKAYIERL